MDPPLIELPLIGEKKLKNKMLFFGQVHNSLGDIYCRG